MKIQTRVRKTAKKAATAVSRKVGGMKVRAKNVRKKVNRKVGALKRKLNRKDTSKI